MSNDYSSVVGSYNPPDSVRLANQNISSINYGISLTMDWMKKQTGRFNKRANLDNPLIQHHLSKAANAILAAASHEGSRHLARAQASVDSSLLHYREAAKHLMMSSQDKSIVMNPGLAYFEMTGAPQDMIERHKNWKDDEVIFGSMPSDGDYAEGDR